MSRLDRPIIYFLKRADGDVKIGKTFEDLFNQRVQGIMREHGPLELLGIIDGYSAKERELHKRFEAHRRRVLVNGPRVRCFWHWTEWFAPVDELLDFIHQHAAPFTYQGRNPSRIRERAAASSSAFLGRARQ